MEKNKNKNNNKKAIIIIISIITYSIFFYSLSVLVNSIYESQKIVFASNEDNNSTVQTSYIKKPIIIVDKLFSFTGNNYTDITTNKTNLQLTNFTVSVWFNTLMDVQKQNSAFIINKGGSDSDRQAYNMNYGIWLNAREQIQAGFENKSGYNFYITTNDRYNDGKWHNAILEFNALNQTLSLYVDGNMIASNSTLFKLPVLPDNTGEQPLRVGANSLVMKGKISGNYTGYVDNIQIWNTYLGSNEIIKIYNKEIKLFDKQNNNNNNTKITTTTSSDNNNSGSDSSSSNSNNENNESGEENIFTQIGGLFSDLFKN